MVETIVMAMRILAIRFFRYSIEIVLLWQDRLGLTHLICHTNRYIRARPADALLLNYGIFVLTVVGIPVWIVAWIFTPLSVWWCAGVSVALFLLPPLFTTVACELGLWFEPWDR